MPLFPCSLASLSMTALTPLMPPAATTAGLPPSHTTPLKPHPGAAGKLHSLSLEARTPVSAQAARSGAGRRPLSADTDTTPGPEGGAAACGEGKEDNPLAFLAIAASMDDD